MDDNEEDELCHLPTHEAQQSSLASVMKKVQKSTSLLLHSAPLCASLHEASHCSMPMHAFT